MVGEQIQNYVNLVGGLTRATKSKASEAAQGLLSAAGLEDVAADASGRVTTLAEEIIAASRANRELLVKLVSAEVDKAAAKIGFARIEDLDELRAEVSELRAALAAQTARSHTAEADAAESSAVASTTNRSAAKKATSNATAKKATTKRATTKKAAAKKSTTKKSAAKKSPTVVKGSAAKKTAAAPAETE